LNALDQCEWEGDRLDEMRARVSPDGFQPGQKGDSIAFAEAEEFGLSRYSHRKRMRTRRSSTIDTSEDGTLEF